MTIWPKRDARALAEEHSGDLESLGVIASLMTNSLRISDAGLSGVRASETALRFDPHLRKFLVALYAVSMLVALLIVRRAALAADPVADFVQEKV